MQNKIKCVVVGDGAVGKTSILMAYTFNRFPFDYVPTVYDTHSIEVSSHGQEDYDRLRPIGYHGTHVFVVCYSVDNRVSMNNVRQKWIPEITHHCPRVPYILVGTKTDVRRKHRMGISTEEGINFAKAMKASAYVECSARYQENLHSVFAEAVDAAVRKKIIKCFKCVLI